MVVYDVMYLVLRKQVGLVYVMLPSAREGGGLGRGARGSIQHTLTENVKPSPWAPRTDRGRPQVNL